MLRQVHLKKHLLYCRGKHPLLDLQQVSILKICWCRKDGFAFSFFTRLMKIYSLTEYIFIRMGDLT